MKGAALDKWSWIHLGTGAVAGYAGIDKKTVFWAGLVYEGIEYYFFNWHAQAFEGSGRESYPNILADMVLLWAGYEIGFKMRRGK